MSVIFLVWERFLTCLKNVSQCEIVGLAVGHGENLNLAVLSETSKCGKCLVKLCMRVLLIELYLFMPLTLTMTAAQSHSSTRQFKKIFCTYEMETVVFNNIDWIMPFFLLCIQGR